MKTIEEITDELLKIGYTKEKITELLDLIAPDIQEEILMDLAGIATDEEISQFETELGNAQTPEAVNAILERIAVRTYGDKADSKREEITVRLLEEIRQSTLNMRDTYQKYMSKDPQTVEKVNKAQKSEDVKKMMQEMEEEGFDFQAEATK